MWIFCGESCGQTLLLQPVLLNIARTYVPKAEFCRKFQIVVWHLVTFRHTCFDTYTSIVLSVFWLVFCFRYMLVPTVPAGTIKTKDNLQNIENVAYKHWECQKGCLNFQLALYYHKSIVLLIQQTLDFFGEMLQSVVYGSLPVFQKNPLSSS